MKPTYGDSVVSLLGETKGGGPAKGPISEWQIFGDITLPTESEIQIELTRLDAEWTAQEYARNRATEYPSSGDQMDMIYKDNKNSTTTHAAAVEAVKTKWPKDNSGPV